MPSHSRQKSRKRARPSSSGADDKGGDAGEQDAEAQLVRRVHSLLSEYPGSVRELSALVLALEEGRGVCLADLENARVRSLLEDVLAALPLQSYTTRTVRAADNEDHDEEEEGGDWEEQQDKTNIKKKKKKRMKKEKRGGRAAGPGNGGAETERRTWGYSVESRRKQSLVSLLRHALLNVGVAVRTGRKTEADCRAMQAVTAVTPLLTAEPYLAPGMVRLMQRLVKGEAVSVDAEPEAVRQMLRRCGARPVLDASSSSSAAGTAAVGSMELSLPTDKSAREVAETALVVVHNVLHAAKDTPTFQHAVRLHRAAEEDKTTRIAATPAGPTRPTAEQLEEAQRLQATAAAETAGEDETSFHGPALPRVGGRTCAAGHASGSHEHDPDEHGQEVHEQEQDTDVAAATARNRRKMRAAQRAAAEAAKAAERKPQREAWMTVPAEGDPFSAMVGSDGSEEQQQPQEQQSRKKDPQQKTAEERAEEAEMMQQMDEMHAARGPSLYELHQQQKAASKNGGIGTQRLQSFDRSVDMQVGGGAVRMDRRSAQQLVANAKKLDSRFDRTVQKSFI